ncbi:hypothetical protein HJG60_007811 [Phyllostomus discolor]|uniref:Uncharacterized protein n=1 Tax=Phyllostomus discolor TaxID=89673 RepID=A0A834BJF4_9CHIR|nr:hypothetical protein HJG60_007811 [Phyllostomus discolor]
MSLWAPRVINTQRLRTTHKNPSNHCHHGLCHHRTKSNCKVLGLPITSGHEAAGLRPLRTACPPLSPASEEQVVEVWKLTEQLILGQKRVFSCCRTSSAAQSPGSRREGQSWRRTLQPLAGTR